MKNQLLKTILTKISNGTASDEELQQYHRWYNSLLGRDMSNDQLKKAKVGVTTEMWGNISRQIFNPSEHAVSSEIEIIGAKNRLITFISAAIVLLVMSLVVYFYAFRKTTFDTIQEQYSEVLSDTMNGVILTLADGKQLNLTNTSDGTIQSNAELEISKSIDLLSYVRTDNDVVPGNDNVIQYNSLFIPMGKTFQLILSDGTKVWLNTKSILRYPTQFSGVERRVQLIGEGYFEVAKNINKPFIVESVGQELKVLGTRFNVSAYSDDKVISTLFEGRIHVKSTRSGSEAFLLPGEQVTLHENSIQKENVNLKNVLGWKNGYFVFHHELLSTICNTLSRWYDVEFDVSNNPKIMNQVYTGTMPRFENITDVLDILSATGSLNYKSEGRRIIFMK